jgi:hypothetical protein
MHSANSYSPTSGTSSESGDSAFVGFDMAYGGNLWNWGRTRIGWDFGFGLLPINIKENLSLSGNFIQNTYEFGIPSSTTHLPPPGYQGGPNGGPWLDSSPNSTSPPDVTSHGVSLTGSRTLDVMLYTVRLGPSLYWDLNEDLGLSAGVGPAVGIVSGSLKYDETIATTRYTGQVDATDVVYGGYVNATLMYHLEKNGDLYLGVQYMSLGDATISGGGREGRLNLNGQVYITAGINWAF